MQYKPAMENSGICHISQVISLDQDVSCKMLIFLLLIYLILQQLEQIGVHDSSHREKMLDGIGLIKTAESAGLSYSQSTQPYQPQLLSQASTVSTSSVGSNIPPAPQTLEVLRIQMKKTYSSSSSSSADNN